MNKLQKKILTILIQYIKPSDTILEFGSGSGHLSCALLEKGYSVSLLDLREEAITGSMRLISSIGLQTNFYVGSLFQHDKKYHGIFNTGCIQCFPATSKGITKEDVIDRCAHLADYIIFFWPLKNYNQRDIGDSSIPGYKQAKEYEMTQEIFMSITKHAFPSMCECGKIKTNLNYDFEWGYASK